MHVVVRHYVGAGINPGSSAREVIALKSRGIAVTISYSTGNNGLLSNIQIL